MTNWVPLLIALVSTAGVVVGAIMAYFATRGKTRADVESALAQTKTAIDARIDARVSAELQGAWDKLDELEREFNAFRTAQARKMSAVARIMRAIARQWPDSHGPDLDPADIAEIEDIIPVTWIRRTQPSPKKE